MQDECRGCRGGPKMGTALDSLSSAYAIGAAYPNLSSSAGGDTPGRQLDALMVGTGACVAADEAKHSLTCLLAVAGTALWAASGCRLTDQLSWGVKSLESAMGPAGLIIRTHLTYSVSKASLLAN